MLIVNNTFTETTPFNKIHVHVPYKQLLCIAGTCLEKEACCPHTSKMRARERDYPLACIHNHTHTHTHINSRGSLLLCAEDNSFLSIQIAISGDYYKILGYRSRETVLQLNRLQYRGTCTRQWKRIVMHPVYVTALSKVIRQWEKLRRKLLNVPHWWSTMCVGCMYKYIH